MDADRTRWDEKYQRRPREMPNAEGFVEQHIGRLVGSTVLDVACGDGANALFLAEQGFEVTGVDISGVALKRLREFSDARGLDICTRRVDLDDDAAMSELGCFDNLVVTRFKPPSAFWDQVSELLRPDGVLLLATFSIRQHRAHGFPARFCLEPGELVEVSDDLECVEHVEYGGDDEYLEGYVFRRR